MSCTQGALVFIIMSGTIEGGTQQGGFPRCGSTFLQGLMSFVLIFLRWTPHPVIVAGRDNKDCIRVVLYSYYTTMTGNSFFNPCHLL